MHYFKMTNTVNAKKGQINKKNIKNSIDIRHKNEKKNIGEPKRSIAWFLGMERHMGTKAHLHVYLMHTLCL